VDLYVTLAIGALVAVLSVAYAARVARAGRAQHPRVDAEGESALLAKGVMEMMCWWAQPVVSACAALHVSPNAVTLASLGFGLAAGAAFAAGSFGLGAALAIAAAAGDAVDGLLARRLHVASEGGEVLDAAVDRYVDFALLGGIAVHLRAHAGRLVLALLAILASFMISYSSAKAEALRADVPRGSLRRVERVVLVVVAAALVPAARWLSAAWADAPLLVALGVLAVFGNLSAVHRLGSLRAAVVEREDKARADPAGRAAEW
jgi:phosphatidylglycerophosphate synthase